MANAIIPKKKTADVLQDLSKDEKAMLFKDFLKDTFKESFQEMGFKTDYRQIRLDEALTEYKRIYKNKRKPSSLKALKQIYHKNGICTFAKKHLGLNYVHEIDKQVINQYYNWLMAKNKVGLLNITTIRTYLTRAYSLLLGFFESEDLQKFVMKGFELPYDIDESGKQREYHNLNLLMKTLNCIFDDYLAHKSEIELKKSKDQKTVRGIHLKTLLHLASFMMNLAFCSRRIEICRLKWENIYTKEQLINELRFDEKELWFLKKDDWVISYKKKPRGLKFSYIHPVIRNILKEIRYYIDSLKNGNIQCKSRARFQEFKPQGFEYKLILLLKLLGFVTMKTRNRIRYINGKLNPKIQIRHVIFSPFKLEQAMYENSLNVYLREVSKKYYLTDYAISEELDEFLRYFNFKPKELIKQSKKWVNYHDIRYVIGSDFHKHHLNPDEAIALMGHTTYKEVSRTMRKSYDKLQNTKQIYASWKWQTKVLFKDRRTKAITHYFLNEHNFDYINHYNNYIKKRYHNQFTEDNKNEEIIKELQRILDNGLELNQKEFAEQFETSEAYISTIRKNYFPKKKFRGLNYSKSKRLSKEQRKELFNDIEIKLNTKVNKQHKLKEIPNEKKHWVKFAEKHDVSYGYLHKILKDDFKIKFNTLNGRMGKKSNVLELMKDCHDIIKNNKNVKASALVKKHKCSRRTVVKYRQIMKLLLLVEYLFLKF